MDEWRGRTAEERAFYARNHHLYLRSAPIYDIAMSPMAELRQTVARISGARIGSKVLDVATGTGAQARAFAAMGAEVVGIDVSHEMLRVARRRSSPANLSFAHADAIKLPFAAESFDIVGASLVLHEMPSSLRETALREMWRVAKPGGTLLIADLCAPRGSWRASLLFHAMALFEERRSFREFIRSDLRATLSGCGFLPREEHLSMLGTARVLVCERGPAPAPS